MVEFLAPGYLTTWEETKAAFLGYFFTKSRSTYLRSKIGSYQQLGFEIFHEAWERFKEYTLDCPHQGYTDVNLLNIFYNGVNENHQNAMGTASSGDFMSKTVEEAYILIDNLSASQANRKSEFDSDVILASKGTDATKEMEQLLSELKEVKESYFVDATAWMQPSGCNFVDATEWMQPSGYDSVDNN